MTIKRASKVNAKKPKKPKKSKRFRRTKAQLEAIDEAIYLTLEADNPQSVRHVYYCLAGTLTIPHKVVRRPSGIKTVSTLLPPSSLITHLRVPSSDLLS